MLKELINLANHLDKKGLRKEADFLDRVITKLSNDNILPDLGGAEAGSMLAAGAGAAGIEATMGALGAGALGAAALGAGAVLLAGYTMGLGVNARNALIEASEKSELIFFDNVLKRALSDVLRRVKSSMTPEQIKKEHAAMMSGKPTQNLLQNLKISDINRHYESLKSSASNASGLWNEEKMNKMKAELFDKVLNA